MPDSKTIAVIDYGAGNLRSVMNALSSLGYRPQLTQVPSIVIDADAVIFPGVGAGADTMHHLNESGMSAAIRKVIAQDRPFFAVCIGMQVLFDSTEEGEGCECLGVVPGQVRRIPPGLKVPHMGWNQVRQHLHNPVFDGIQDGANFYFVHSYCALPADPAIVVGTTDYGTTLCSMIIKGNLVATQFHPEKSGALGLRMYKNFLDQHLGG